MLISLDMAYYFLLWVVWPNW